MSTRKKLIAFWHRDESLTVLLGTVVFLVFFVQPLAEIGWLAKSFIALAGAFVLAAGLLVVSGRPVLIALGGILAAGSLLCDIAVVFSPRPGILALRDAFTLVFLGLLNAVILSRVVRDGPVNRSRIQGAILAYLILGLMWAQAYWCLETLSPGAFAPAIKVADSDGHGMKLTYFSFVTLTTLGYGDITPVAPFARSLAVLESLTGQLFPTILIARLVAMEIESRKDDKAGR
jgi:ion channel